MSWSAETARVDAWNPLDYNGGVLRMFYRRLVSGNLPRASLAEEESRLLAQLTAVTEAARSSDALGSNPASIRETRVGCSNASPLSGQTLLHMPRQPRTPDASSGGRSGRPRTGPSGGTGPANRH